jgi:uncharacterized membrane protein
VLAVAVRIPGLNSGLWIDEITSVIESFRVSFPESLTHFPGDNKHPLYAVLAHASASLFGEHPWAYRLPALMFGAACVPALYVLGSRVTSRREAFAASALLALSYHHVWFSQNARGYTMLMFWTLIGTWLLLRAIESGRASDWIKFGLVSGAGAYTHLTYAFTIAGQLLVVSGWLAVGPGQLRRERAVNALIGFAAAAAVSFLLYAPMASDVVKFFGRGESNLKGVSTPQWALQEGIRVLKLGIGAAGVAGTLALLCAAAVAIAGVVSYLRGNRLACLLFVAPGVVTVALAFFGRGTMYPRFFFAFMGFAFLILMRGIFVAAEWLGSLVRSSPRARATAGEAAAGLVVALSAVSVPLCWALPKQDFVGAMQFVERNVPRSEVVATADVTSLVYPRLFGKQWAALRSGDDLRQLRARTPVWLIYSFPRYLKSFDADIAAAVEKDCGTARRFPGSVGGGEVIVCRMEQSR